MGVDTIALREIAGDVGDEMGRTSGVAIYAAAEDIDALRAQNAAFISAAQKQDQREHELMMERRELARCVMREAYHREFGHCNVCAHLRPRFHKAGCPVALAERVLAEPVANPRAISGDNAPYLAQGGANG